MKKYVTGMLLVMGVVLTGCFAPQGNDGNITHFPAPDVETAWIRLGEPIKFEQELWYPQDAVNILLDSEVYLMGEYRGVQFFIERADVRPYNRLYTKFGRNKFRIFKKKVLDDQR